MKSNVREVPYVLATEVLKAFGHTRFFPDPHVVVRQGDGDQSVAMMTHCGGAIELKICNDGAGPTILTKIDIRYGGEKKLTLHANGTITKRKMPYGGKAVETQIVNAKAVRSRMERLVKAVFPMVQLV